MDVQHTHKYSSSISFYGRQEIINWADISIKKLKPLMLLEIWQ